MTLDGQDGADQHAVALCHYDTVWSLGTLQRIPFSVDAEGVARGPGCFDMKGGIVVLYFALLALRAHGLRAARTLKVLFTSDEEVGSPTSRPLIEKTARGAAVAYVLESPLPGGTLKTARKGTGDFVVRITGRAAHAGVEPQKGISATGELAHQVLALHALNDFAVGTTVNVGVVHGGTRPNVVAAEAEAHVDIRVETLAEADRIEAAIRGLQPHLAGAALESLRRALVLGIRDYATKCGFRTAVLGLSGGIDSALVAALAVEALGRENVTGLGMPSPYSSEGSVADARALARNLGIRFEVLPIGSLFEGAKRALASVFAGRPEDVAEENLQSRLRGLLVMGFSNKHGALVLTTGNKSELAVGYCTLYGDMCGGLAPISDLAKMRVYALARHLNARAGRALVPEASIDKPPSAELRPGQTDQDSLPPYPVLDAILEGLVERHLSVAAVARASGAPPALVAKIARRLDLSEYKRRQAAPGLKVSAKAFGIGRRVPIAQRSPL